MNRILLASIAALALHGVCLAQVSGNAAYSQSGGNIRAKQNERSKHVLQQGEMPPGPTSMFVDASVLMNVKADEYVAVFGIMQEGQTVPECNQKMDSTVAEFSGELKQLGVNPDDIFVDFAAQNKIYGFQVTGAIAKEKLVGFELKKNVAVHYKDKMLLDKLVIAAAKSKIFDLIKVDYVVKDPVSIQARLMDDASQVIKQKAAMYEKLLGIKLQQPAMVYAEKPSIYFPAEMYDSYAASESEEISSDSDRQKYTIQGARKSRTFFYNGLTADGFDHVTNPVIIEPVVQFTLYLKVKYEIEPARK
jgi:uncharacterized protein YggE